MRIYLILMEEIWSFTETSYRQISEYIHVIAYKLMHDKTINESWG